ncbi:MAG: hypothetical protein HWD58_02125 [Bacteroidota bacterium]|nr:MAG: hypothetical protein HWD58_02125 [Bacteroidota bacterium]
MAGTYPGSYCARSSIRFIYLQNSWSPIDEYAHMDYIEKLSAGRMPAVSDTLEPEILNDIIQHPERTGSPAGNDILIGIGVVFVSSETSSCVLSSACTAE